MTNQTNQEPKKVQIWLPLLLSLTLVGGMVIGVKLKPSPPQTQIVIQNGGLHESQKLKSNCLS